MLFPVYHSARERARADTGSTCWVFTTPHNVPASTPPRGHVLQLGPTSPNPQSGYLDVPVCILWFTKTLRWEMLSMRDVHLSPESPGTRQVSVHLGSQSPDPFPKVGACTHPFTERPAPTPPYKRRLLEKMVVLPAPTQPSAVRALSHETGLLAFSAYGAVTPYSWKTTTSPWL